jgi:hypothetical protein
MTGSGTAARPDALEARVKRLEGQLAAVFRAMAAACEAAGIPPGQMGPEVAEAAERYATLPARERRERIEESGLRLVRAGHD